MPSGQDKPTAHTAAEERPSNMILDGLSQVITPMHAHTIIHTFLHKHPPSTQEHTVHCHTHTHAHAELCFLPLHTQPLTRAHGHVLLICSVHTGSHTQTHMHTFELPAFLPLHTQPLTHVHRTRSHTQTHMNTDTSSYTNTREHTCTHRLPFLPLLLLHYLSGPCIQLTGGFVLTSHTCCPMGNSTLF